MYEVTTELVRVGLHLTFYTGQGQVSFIYCKPKGGSSALMEYCVCQRREMSVTLYKFYCILYMYIDKHVYVVYMHVHTCRLHVYVRFDTLAHTHTHTSLQEQTHSDRRESIRLKEELQVYKTRTERLSKLQSAMRSQEHKLEDVDAAMKKITVWEGERREGGREEEGRRE